jgi:hypothetical protein
VVFHAARFFWLSCVTRIISHAAAAQLQRRVLVELDEPLRMHPLWPGHDGNAFIGAHPLDVGAGAHDAQRSACMHAT